MRIKHTLFILIKRPDCARRVGESQRITHVLGHEPGVAVLGGDTHVSAGHREGELGDGGGLLSNGDDVFLAHDVHDVLSDRRGHCASHPLLEGLGLGFAGLEDQAVEAGFVDDRHFLQSSKGAISNRPLFVFIKILDCIICFGKSQRIANVLGHEPRVAVLGSDANGSAGHREDELGDGVGLGGGVFQSIQPRSLLAHDVHPIAPGRREHGSGHPLLERLGFGLP